METSPRNQEQVNTPLPYRFESDTQKLVRRHLQDKDHVITEDELRSVRIGMTPTADAYNPPIDTTTMPEFRNDETDPAGNPQSVHQNMEP